MQDLSGSFVALVTPMFENGDIDYVSLKNLIDWHFHSGTDGIVSVGTTGESATINFNDHHDVLKETLNIINGRMIAIAGTGANSTEEAKDLSLEAERIGYKYSLSVTPYYNKPTQKGLIEHYEYITSKSEISQILYNVPSRTACDMEPSTVGKLSENPKIIGIKEALSDVNRFRELITISKSVSDKHFSILSGDDPSFVDFMSLGAHGVISVAANLIPSKIKEICELLMNNHYKQAKEIDANNKKLYELLFVESNPIPIKWALSELKMIQNGIRLPLTSLSSEYHEEFSSLITNISN